MYEIHASSLSVVLCVCVCAQGLLFTTAECVRSPLDLVRLWLHEAGRVYGDKFIEERDIELFDKHKFKIARDNFEVCPYTLHNHIYMYVRIE